MRKAKQPDQTHNTMQADINNKLLQIIDDYNLDQCVKEPTREKNILDLVLTTNTNMIKKTTIESGMSDHQAVLIEIDIKTKPSRKPPRKVLLYSKGNMQGIRDELQEHYKHFIEENTDKNIELCWESFKSILTSLITKHITSKMVTSSG